MPESISESVGRKRGKNATNRSQDVETVQRLLAAAAKNLGDDQYDPGTPDGLIATPPRVSQTVAAINAFQKRFMRNPDGQVDPGRTTITKLVEAAKGEGEVPAPPPSPSALGSLSLNSFINKSMSEICPSGHANTADNHCAHFVGHTLNITVGLTCHGMMSKRKRKGEAASLRVHVIFDACPTVSEYEDAMANSRGLMFVSGTNNFRTKSGKTTLRNIPKKHIGVFLNGTVWHYSNSRNKVITQTPDEFIKHYRGQKNALWFGTLPPGAITNFRP